MKNKINRFLRLISLPLLALTAFVFTPTVASAQSCASKYPANRVYETAFHDVFKNTCYSCPKGAQRTAESVTSQRACVIPAATRYKPARDHGHSGILGANCRGKIYDVGLARCYTCPGGYARSVYPANSGQACIKHETARFGRATHRGTAPSPEATVKRLAEQELNRFANSLANSLQQLVALSDDPNFVRRLQRNDPSIETQIRQILISNQSLTNQFRTISLGGTGDANVAIINANIDTGISVAINGARPVYWYGGASYGVKVGAGASAGLTLGFWTNENDQIYGDFHGYSVDLFSILSGNAVNTLKNIRSVSSSTGVGFEVAAWFEEANNNRFLGFTVTPSFGKGISITPGGYSRGHTVQITHPTR